MSNNDDPSEVGDEGATETPEKEEADGSFSIADEYQEEIDAKPVAYTGGAWTSNTDELPQPVMDDNISDAQAPPFLIENQVCIADTRSFVVRDRWGETIAEFKEDEASVAPNGRYRVPTALLEERMQTRTPRAALLAELKEKTDGYMLTSDWKDI